MRVVIDIINLQRLKYKLKNMSKIKDRREVVRKASRESARPLYVATKRNTPVGNPSPHPGLLKSSVKLRAAKKSRVRVGVNVIIRSIDWGKALAKGLVKGKYIGSGGTKRPPKQWNIFYGSFVEMGTSKMAPRRFMKNTAKSMGKMVQRDFIRRIFQLIKEMGK